MRFNKTGMALIGIVPISAAILFASRHAVIFGNYGPHLSNFTLSILIVFCVGAAMIIVNKPLWLITGFSIMLVCANIYVEIFISFMNTPDLLDALSGIIGVVFAFGMLMVLLKKGVKQRML